MLGIRLTSAGQTEEGVVFLKKAMRLNPNYPPWLLWMLAVSYYQLGAYDQSIKTYKDYLEFFDDDDPHAYAGLAAAYVVTNRLVEAQKSISRLLEQEPSYTVKNAKVYLFAPEQRQPYINALVKAGLPE